MHNLAYSKIFLVSVPFCSLMADSGSSLIGCHLFTTVGGGGETWEKGAHKFRQKKASCSNQLCVEHHMIYILRVKKSQSHGKVFNHKNKTHCKNMYFNGGM